MGRPLYKWTVVKEDETVQIVEAESIEEAVNEIDDAQPIAIIRGQNVFWG